MKKLIGAFLDDEGYNDIDHVEVIVEDGIVSYVQTAERPNNPYIKSVDILGEIFVDDMSEDPFNDLYMFYMDQNNEVRYTSLTGLGETIPPRDERKEMFSGPVEIDIVKQMASI